MKSFVYAILLFCAISTAVIASGIRDTRATKLLTDQSEALLLSLTGDSETPPDTLLSSFRSSWDEESPRLSYTVSIDHLNEIENALARAEGAFLSKNEALFILEARTLYDATKSLYERIKPSFEGVI